MSKNLPPTWPDMATLEEGCCYDLHQMLQLQIYVLLMMEAMDTSIM